MEVVLSIDSDGALSIRVISLKCLLAVGRNTDAHLYFNKAFDKCQVSFILIIMLKIHRCMHHRRVMQACNTMDAEERERFSEREREREREKERERESHNIHGYTFTCVDELT